MSDKDENENNKDPVDLVAFEAKIRSEMSTEFDVEKQKIIDNRDEILGEKRAIQEQFKDIDPAQLQEFREIQKRAETDVNLKLASEGKMDELTQRLTQGQRAAWDEKTTEYETQLTTKNGILEGLEAEIASLKQTNTNMSKSQYLKDLTSTDDSFKSEYFGHFSELYMRKMDIDGETGSIYALDDSGKRIVDTSGELETFQTYYNKQKVKDGLFWNGASGSGHAGAGDGEGGKPFNQMTSADKTALRTEMGEAKYAQYLVAQLKTN